MTDKTEHLAARVTPLLKARAEETAWQLSGPCEQLRASDVVRMALDEFCTDAERVRDDLLVQNGIDPEDVEELDQERDPDR